jgi:glycosyltransferase involved in cell wall biosynthesis
LTARTDNVMTVSQFSKAELVRCFGARPSAIRVSGEGWQHVRRQPADLSILERHGLHAGRFVLAVSSATPHKNFGVITRALARLPGEGIVLAVAGGDAPGVFADLSLEQRSAVKRLGYVTDGELRALYESAALFVFPSLYEGFGIPPLEAMAHGCPVLASNAAAIPEVCGDAALYFAPQDEAALAYWITRLLREPALRASLRAKGSKQLTKHSWDEAARRHLELLRELLGDPAVSRSGRAAGRPGTAQVSTLLGGGA